MSHEIRTPMNGVLGVLHLLKDEPLSGDGRRLLEEALACGSMLATLLNDVIDVSKVEAGRLELSPEPLNPEAALEGVTNLLRPQAEARGLWLRTMIAPGVGWVSVDPVRLRQMLFNLIGNAVKFTLEGGVEVRLTATGGGPQKRLRVEIEDTGIGIAEGGAGGAVPALPAGRQLHHPPVRRLGPRPGDHPAAGRADGRRGRHAAARRATARPSGSRSPRRWPSPMPRASRRRRRRAGWAACAS